jgi:hypothetical protein
MPKNTNDRVPRDGRAAPSPDTIGHFSAKIPVELSTRFLQHFSEQLYSSPQKAFEELISNGWDAGARCVDVRVSQDLTDPNATMCVLDDGASMDEVGLRQLWHIAFSPKEENRHQYGRRIIGKFGIGKLATYVLANKLTYICKAADGVIRRVTMNYEEIDRQRNANSDRLINELELDVFEVSDDELDSAIASVSGGDALLKLIRNGMHSRPEGKSQEEFGATTDQFRPPQSGTWTLVVLAGLKQTGRDLKIGILRRMLEAALPFESEMAITLNGDLLASSKIDAPLQVEWVIGPDLEIDSVEVQDGGNSEDQKTADRGERQPSLSADKTTKVALTSNSSPFPCVEIPGIGKVTGRVRLFKERITGGKSDERGASNGFHVNVLGRVVNQSDPTFGEENLSHAAWAQFRMTVRVDGLDQHLTTNREQFREVHELRVFRAFLRKAFNKARVVYDSDENAEMPHGGDILVRSLGVVSLSPLRNIVSEALRSKPPIPGLIDETGITDREGKRQSWIANTSDNIRKALDHIKYEKAEDGSFVKFRLTDNTIVVNKDHPFVLEHSRTKAEKELLRTIAMVTLLTDVYALDIGVKPTALVSIRDYRDKLMQFRALQRRKSGTYIAKLLLQTQHDADYRQLEAVLSDALLYLGFQIKDLAKSGEPEGIASAYTIPTFSSPTLENPNPPLYSFTFDAKSSKHETTQTGNIGLDGIVEHRNRYNADHALVVAPGFTGNAVKTRCAELKVTPMTARDLGHLLEYTVEHGAIPLTKLREVFQLYDHEEVAKWVDRLPKWLKDRRQITVDIFLKALERLRGKVPDVLPAGTIAYECRVNLGAVTAKAEDVIAVARGLTILIPDLVGVDGDKIVVNASAERVAAAVQQ